MDSKVDSEVDHYRVLGLPSGVEGVNLTAKDISKAYRLKALELHPDKRRDDPKAHEKFQKLQYSYHALKGEKKRKPFVDVSSNSDLGQAPHQSQQESMRKKMMYDLKQKELSALSFQRNQEDIHHRQCKQSFARVRADHANKRTSPGGSTRKDTIQGGRQSGSTAGNKAPTSSTLAGSGHQALEESVLQKLKKAAQKQQGIVKQEAPSSDIAPTGGS